MFFNVPSTSFHTLVQASGLDSSSVEVNNCLPSFFGEGTLAQGPFPYIGPPVKGQQAPKPPAEWHSWIAALGWQPDASVRICEVLC